MPAPLKFQIIDEMYQAWIQVTVLDDKSMDHFKSIINQCIDTNCDTLHVKKTGQIISSTGSVLVISRKNDNGIIRHELAVTATFSFEGSV